MSRPIHFEIPADDPDRAIGFYAQAFGWKARKFEGMEYWLVSTGAEGEPGIDGGIGVRREKSAADERGMTKAQPARMSR